MTPSLFLSFLFLSQCCSLFSRSLFQLPCPPALHRGLPVSPTGGTAGGDVGTRTPPCAPAPLSQLGFCRYAHLKCDPLPKAVGGTQPVVTLGQVHPAFVGRRQQAVLVLLSSEPEIITGPSPNASQPRLSPEMLGRTLIVRAFFAAQGQSRAPARSAQDYPVPLRPFKGRRLQVLTLPPHE